jgi:hypothetical protein
MSGPNLSTSVFRFKSIPSFSFGISRLNPLRESSIRECLLPSVCPTTAGLFNHEPAM